MVASIVKLLDAGDTSNATSYTTGSFTPAVGDLLILCAYFKATTDSPTVSASANGVTTFTETVIQGDAGAARLVIAVADQLTTGASAMTITASLAADASSGMGYTVLAARGMTNVGAAAIKQTAGSDNNLTSGATPSLTFGSAPVSTNPVVAHIGNNSNPANCTEPTGFTEHADSGFNSPTSGYETVSINGSCPQTVTWGGTNATRGAVLGLELDASGGAPPPSEFTGWGIPA